MQLFQWLNSKIEVQSNVDEFARMQLHSAVTLLDLQAYQVLQVNTKIITGNISVKSNLGLGL